MVTRRISTIGGRARCSVRCSGRRSVRARARRRSGVCRRAMKRDRGGAAANAANSPLSAAQGREADPWQRKFRFAPQTRTEGLSRGRSVGDVAAAGPRGVYAAPPAADLPHSGGVRRHRRYVLAPLIPQPWPCRSMAAPRRRSELLFRIGRSHRVGCAFDPPARVVPYTTCSGAICGGSDLFWRNLRGNAISYQRLRVPGRPRGFRCRTLWVRVPRSFRQLVSGYQWSCS